MRHLRLQCRLQEILERERLYKERFEHIQLVMTNYDAAKESLIKTINEYIASNSSENEENGRKDIGRDEFFYNRPELNNYDFYWTLIDDIGSEFEVDSIVKAVKVAATGRSYDKRLTLFLLRHIQKTDKQSYNNISTIN